MNTFDEAYRAAAGYFGERPEAALVRNLAILTPDHPVLDIGSGQGRNALYLARNGFTVDALDPSGVAGEQLSHTAGKHDLRVRTIQGTFQDLAFAEGGYGAILVFGLIPLLERLEIDALAAMVTSALGAGGLLFVTAFGTWDPACPRHASEWQAAGANSFRGPKGDLRTYLEPGELRALFPTFTEVSSWEGPGPEHRHSDGPLERHGLVEVVLRR